MFCLEYKNLIPQDVLQSLESLGGCIRRAHDSLCDVAGCYYKYSGWLRLEDTNTRALLDRIKETARKLSEECEYLLVLGIGGSYLGTRALLESLRPPDEKRVLYAGYHLDSEYHHELLEFLRDKSFAINVVSKSGQSTETLMAFELFRRLLEKTHGKATAQQRIIITTAPENNPLRALAHNNHYTSFDIPNDIGGRYSVLTPVGLFPMAFAGVCIETVLDGAYAMNAKTKSLDLSENDVYVYAALRNILYQKQHLVELLAITSPRLQVFGEWWKQLFAESEGKEGKGILPISCHFTTDLHSLWQFIQDGTNILFETILLIQDNPFHITPIHTSTDFPHLKACTNKNMHTIHTQIIQGVSQTHQEKNQAHIILKIPSINEYVMGGLVMFFQKACAMSAQILGVNPFNQESVDRYKYRFLRSMSNLE